VRKSCPLCRASVEQQTLGPLSVEDPPLKLTVEGMPAARCAKNHPSPVDNDFMLWLIQELKERAAVLPAASESGMIFKKHLCACGKELAAKPERRQAWPQELAYEGYPAFKAGIELPVYKCTGCGKEQLRSTKEAHRHTAQAVAALNDAAKFPHSG
jgi:hypothetical protein